MDITKDVIMESINGIYSFLDFTVETGDDFSDGWLPTLDTSLRVNGNNQVDYIYYEKPTTTNTTIHQNSAMGENAKMQCLANDLVRRFLNTREDLPSSYREMIVDKYGIKLMTSGYSRDQTRKIMTNGIKGYLTKLKRRKLHGRRIHYTASESKDSRIKKKLTGKSSWYRKRIAKKDDERMTARTQAHGSRGLPRTQSGKQDLKTRAVLFVEQTPHGELAKRIKELLQRLEPVLGFRLRVVERTGRSIKSHLSQLTSTQGRMCGRTQCVTCNQDCEAITDCTRNNVVYESICTRCNPGASGKGELEQVRPGAPSLYVGETSRSINERAQEHWGSARRMEDKSHIHKHQLMEHGGDHPEFVFKLISSHKTALSRQIKEAVRIRRRGGANNILNSKGEYNRCHIPRLVVEEEDPQCKEQRLLREEQEAEELTRSLEQDDMSWRRERGKRRSSRRRNAGG